MVQLPPTGTELPHVLLWLKSAGFVPLIEMLVMLNTEVAALVRVTFCGLLVTCRGWLAKVRDEGERPTVEDEVPVPVSVAGTGEIADVKVTLTVAERLPTAAGVKLMLIVQDAPALMLPQLFVWEKSDALAPPMVIVETRTVLWPTLESVSVWPADFVPTA
jgi:hypothetical protein